MICYSNALGSILIPASSPLSFTSFFGKYKRNSYSQQENSIIENNYALAWFFLYSNVQELFVDSQVHITKITTGVFHLVAQSKEIKRGCP